jgi:hypothetical protein
MRLLACLLLLAALVAAGCSPGEAESILEQGPRFPDAEGVVTDINFESVRLDDKSSFPINNEIESFNSRTHKIKALLSWKGWYVHLGLNRERQAVWISGLAVTPEADPSSALYAGAFEKVDKGRAIFADGTVLRLASGVKTPTKGTKTSVTIDTKAHRVSKLDWAR